jgi:hypothetical protein
MCSVRRAKAIEKDGKLGFRALCPFSSHASPAVVGQKAFVPYSAQSSDVVTLKNSDFVTPRQPSPNSVVSPANGKRGPPARAL